MYISQSCSRSRVKIQCRVTEHKTCRFRLKLLQRPFFAWQKWDKNRCRPQIKLMRVNAIDLQLTCRRFTPHDKRAASAFAEAQIQQHSLGFILLLSRTSRSGFLIVTLLTQLLRIPQLIPPHNKLLVCRFAVGLIFCPIYFGQICILLHAACKSWTYMDRLSALTSHSSHKEALHYIYLLHSLLLWNYDYEKCE
jgi:hypothetical protein